MARRMLIDASHPEETRVVVVDGTRLEEFDFETSTRKPLKGNIYLAKVIRIEPSLQAAFVEYGGNRHGFLAFSEIHPDYYQIPVADRERLIAEQQRLHAEADDDHEPRRRRRVDRSDIEDARASRREEPAAEAQPEPRITAPAPRPVTRIVDPMVEEMEEQPLFTEQHYDDRRPQKSGGWMSLFGGGRQRYDQQPAPAPQARSTTSARPAVQPMDAPHVDEGEDLEIPSFLRRLAN